MSRGELERVEVMGRVGRGNLKVMDAARGNLVSDSSSTVRPVISASSSKRFLLCASRASAGVTPAAPRSRLPFSRHSIM
jgi:hypothetical protein